MKRTLSIQLYCSVMLFGLAVCGASAATRQADVTSLPCGIAKASQPGVKTGALPAQRLQPARPGVGAEKGAPQDLVAAGGSGSSPPDYAFTKIATIGDPAPGPEGGTYSFDFEPYGLNNRGEAAYAADVSTGGEGVFVSRRRGVAQLMRSGEPAPGGGLFGIGVWGHTAINQRGDVAFQFALDPFLLPLGLNSGVYRFSGRTGEGTALVIPGTTPEPGGGVFQGGFIHASINDAGDVAFSGIVNTTAGIASPPSPAGFDLGMGVYVAEARGGITSIAAPGDPAPGGGTFDFAENPSINDRGDVAFGAHVAGEECLDFATPQDFRIFCAESVYLKKRATGDVLSIAHQGDAAPGGGTYRLAFGPVLNNRGQAAFIGDLTPAPDAGQSLAVFLFSNGTVTPVARPGDAMPGGGTMVTASFFIANYHVNDHGDVAFNATLNTATGGVSDTGLYVRSRGRTGLVARTGTVIPGVGTIATLRNTPFETTYASGAAILNDRGQVLFTASLTDGSFVLLVATPTRRRDRDDVAGSDSPAAPDVDGARPAHVSFTSIETPVRGAGRVQFTLQRPATATLRLYDVAGRRVATIASGSFTAGEHAVTIDTARLAPGMYLLKLEADGLNESRKLIVMR